MSNGVRAAEAADIQDDELARLSRIVELGKRLKHIDSCLREDEARIAAVRRRAGALARDRAELRRELESLLREARIFAAESA